MFIWRYVFLCFIISRVVCQLQQLRLPVDPDLQDRLSQALKKLTDELQYFCTPSENRMNIYRRICVAEQYLKQVNQQVSQCDNFIVGSRNNVLGSKNVIIGNFNTLKGNNNYVFLEKYRGRAEGDLLLGKWRIQMQKKNQLLINSRLVISFLNSQSNRKYIRFMAKTTHPYGYGTNLGENVVLLIKEQNQDFQTYPYPNNPFQARHYTYRQNNQFQYGSNLLNSNLEFLSAQNSETPYDKHSSLTPVSKYNQPVSSQILLGSDQLSLNRLQIYKSIRQKIFTQSFPTSYSSQQPVSVLISAQIPSPQNLSYNSIKLEQQDSKSNNFVDRNHQNIISQNSNKNQNLRSDTLSQQFFVSQVTIYCFRNYENKS